jgi:hypothetical protein
MTAFVCSCDDLHYWTEGTHMTRTQRLVISAVLLALTGIAGFASAGAHAESPPAASDKADRLWEAARKGDVAAVKTLLDEGVDVNTKFRYVSRLRSRVASSPRQPH